MQQIETYALKLHATSTDTVQIIKLDLSFSHKECLSLVVWAEENRDLLFKFQTGFLTGTFYFINSRNSKRQNRKCSLKIGKKFVCATRKISLPSQDSQDDG